MNLAGAVADPATCANFTGRAGHCARLYGVIC
jgi:hypothetical protein